jgi:hypothetical protein
VLVEMGELLIQEQQVLVVVEETAAAAAVAPTMAVQTGLEEIQEVIQEPTDQKTQVALLEEMEAQEVRLAVEMAALVEM